MPFAIRLRGGSKVPSMEYSGLAFTSSPRDTPLCLSVLVRRATGRYDCPVVDGHSSEKMIR
jgi:hypothetical protein